MSGDSLGKAVLRKLRQPHARLVYGVMASATTVYVNGSATAVPASKLVSAGTLATNDYVAVLETVANEVVADRLILGEVTT